MSTSDGLARSAFYGFTYVPFASLNGSGSNANSITNSSINSEFNKKEYFSFLVSSLKTKDSPKTCSTTITVTCLENYRGSSDLVLMAAIIENDVDYFNTYEVAAGNGKNNYSHVLRKYISGPEGVSLSAVNIGSKETFSFNYENDEIYNHYQNLRVVVFIQDRTTKEIFGAYQMETHPFQEATIVSNDFNNIKNDIILNKNNHLFLNTSISGLISIEIKKLNGQTISKSKVNVSMDRKDISLNTKSLSKGLYFVLVRGIINKQFKIVIP